MESLSGLVALISSNWIYQLVALAVLLTIANFIAQATLVGRAKKQIRSGNSEGAERVSEAEYKERAGLSFRMPISDVFMIQGRGVVVTGRVDQGTIRVGDSLQVTGSGSPLAVTVTGIEAFNKQLQETGPGQSVGILLKGVSKGDIKDHSVLES